MQHYWSIKFFNIGIVLFIIKHYLLCFLDHKLNYLPPGALIYSIQIFSHLKLCFDTAIHIFNTLPALDTAIWHVKMCRWMTSYVPHSQFQVL